ncbi:MAG: hypothetical protein IJB72_07895 [Clostridia bacterium]|nr:hypothetical protein [Clostridia bacterium]
MKKLLKNLGFHKMDEMEQHIAFKAQRNALVFLLSALFIWTIYESYKVYTFHSELNLFPCFLLATASCIQTFSQLIMTHNAVKDDEESPKASPLLKTILICLVVVAVIITIGSIIVLSVVKL